MTVPPSLLPLEPLPAAPDARASTPYIRLHGLSKHYPGEAQALRETDLEIRHGEALGIISRSGAGKSSLIRTLNRLERPSEGQVLVDGEDIGGYDSQRPAALHRRIGIIFQHLSLTPAKTVWQNTALLLRVAGVPRARIEERVAGSLQLVDLEEKRGAYPAQLSGGQKQHVGITCTLVHQPQILLCDEATSALDPENAQVILVLLRDINRRLDPTIVLIAHEMTIIREICDRVVVLECGRIVEQGEVQEVSDDPRHAVTRSLLGNLRAALPADLQARPRQAPGTGDPVLLDPQCIGVSRRVPGLLAITRATGQRVDLFYGGIERIQGHALRRLLLQVGAPPGKLPDVLAKVTLVADKMEVLGHVVHT